LLLAADGIQAGIVSNENLRVLGREEAGVPARTRPAKGLTLIAAGHRAWVPGFNPVGSR